MLIVVGAMPPPVTGFSAINAEMSRLLRENVEKFLLIDRTPKRGYRRILVELRNLFLFFRASRDPSAKAYLAYSGGLGQIIDIFYSLACRVSNTTLYVHHHSYAYINKNKSTTRIFTWLNPGAKHIFLHESMAEAFASRYSVPESNCVSICNAAFLEPPTTNPNDNRSIDIRIGFLSNITEEKGIFEFLELAKRFLSSGTCVKFYVAGPIEASVADRVRAAVAQLPNCKLEGALYGAAKISFFDSLDIFLFPSKYSNEAQPLVILEAMRSGAYAIATDRGCIAGLLTARSGSAFHQDEFLDSAERKILEISSLPPAQRATLRQSVRSDFNVLQTKAKQDLGRILAKLAGAEIISCSSD